MDREAASSRSDRQTTRVDRTRSTWGGALLGIGVMASIDEMWFHQILGWHHFYDGATPAIGLMTDGLLHAFELLSLTAGFFLIIGLHRRREIDWRWLGAGFLMGMGAFLVLDAL